MKFKLGVGHDLLLGVAESSMSDTTPVSLISAVIHSHSQLLEGGQGAAF
jgi:hypothetical protein